MASSDVKYVITVDSTGAQRAIETFDQALDKLNKTTDSTKAGTKSFSDEFVKKLIPSFTAATLAADAIKKAFSFVKSGITDTINAAVESEKANRALESTLQIVGETSSGTADQIRDYADTLMRQTLYDDEAIKSAQTLIIQMRGTTDQIEAATRGAIGLASVFQMDLQSAARAVAQGFEGNYRAIGMLIPTVRQATTEGDKHAAMMKALADYYKRAESETQTFGGAITQLKNMFGEAAEALGAAIVNNEQFRQVIQDVKDRVVELIASGSLEQWANFIASAVNSATDAIQGFLNVTKGFGTGNLFEGIADNVIDVDDIIYERTQSAKKNIADFAKSLQVLKPSFAEMSYAIEGGQASWDAYTKRVGELDVMLQGFGPTVKAAVADLAQFLKQPGPVVVELTNDFIALTRAMQVAHSAAKPIDPIPNIVALTFNYKLLATAVEAINWGKHRGELAAVEDWLYTTTRAIDEQLPALAGYSSSIDTATRHLEIMKRAMEGMNGAAEKSKWDKFASDVTQAVGIVSTAWSGFSDQATKNSTIALDNEYKKRLAVINATVKDETKKQNAILALEAEFQIKRQDAARKGAVITKAVNIMEAATNTYAAASRALKDFPFPLSVIVAGIVTGLGLAQVALIAKQPIPLARGAVFTKPTLLPAVTGQTYQVAEAGEPEVVAPRSTIVGAVKEAVGQMFPQMAYAGAGASVSLNFYAPLITSSGLVDSDLMGARDKLVKYVNEGLRDLGHRAI